MTATSLRNDTTSLCVMSQTGSTDSDSEYPVRGDAAHKSVTDAQEYNTVQEQLRTTVLDHIAAGESIIQVTVTRSLCKTTN